MREKSSLTAAVRAAIESAAHDSASRYLAEAPAHAAALHTERQGFEERLATVWGEALDLYDVVVEVCRHYGSEINGTDRPQAAASQSFRFEVLVNLHVRSCRTAREIGALLRAGYAKGALARWRAMHELAIVARLIADGDDELAERYLLHDHVDALDAMKEYNEHAAQLGETPLDDVDLDEATTAYDQMIRRFGKKFAGQNGWAAGLVDRPTWKQLEQKAELGHLRPYYTWSSHSIHATPKGGRLTMLDTADGVFLEVGPNTSSLADPASAALASLCSVTVGLLGWQLDDEARASSATRAIAMRTILMLRETADEILLAAHREHERRVAATWSPVVPPR